MRNRFRAGTMAGWLIAAAGAVVLFAPGGPVSHPPAGSGAAAVAQRPAGPDMMVSAAAPSDRAVAKLASLVWVAGSKPAPAPVPTPVPPSPMADAGATPQAPAADGRYLVALNDVNVHADPQNVSRKVFTLARGENVSVAESQGGWVEVTSASGETGWVYSKYLSEPQTD